jgi:alpha-tubulin suppressor-like RCC1 family protein
VSTRTLGAALILAAGLLVISPAAQAETVAPTADPTASTFTSLTPVRVLDTRTSAGPVGQGGTVTVDLASRVPVTATAVVLNVTGVTPTSNTFVTVFPGGTTRPTASSLNLVPGDTRPNQVTVSLGANRTVSLYNNVGNVHLVADLAGYYGTGAGAKYTALPPQRVFDTRDNNAAVGPGGTMVLGLGEWIPASATAVTFNLTATNATASTFVTAWPADAPRPNASNVNVPIGDTRANLVTVAVGADLDAFLYNNAGSVDLIVDLAGFYTPDYGASFVPLSPTRVLDTRNGTGTPGTNPVGPGAVVDLFLGNNGVPVTSTGAVLNVTGVDATTATYVAAYPDGALMTFIPSTLNLSPGQTVPNAAAVAFAHARQIELYNNAGNVHLVADLAGYFVVADPLCTTDCVLAWGRNDDQKLGIAQAVPGSAVPAPVATLSGVRAVASDNTNGYALRADGTVWAWGSNHAGQLGNGWRVWGSSSGSPVPVPVLGLTNVSAITSGGYGGYALRSDGTVWAWGSNDAGQLGDGSLNTSSVPVRVSGLTGVTAIAAAAQTAYALRNDGTVWAWGGNFEGQLGNGSTAWQSSVPVQVAGLAGVSAIANGGHGGYAVLADGTAWAWGFDNYGQLGSGQPCTQDPCESRVPVRVSGLTGVTAIAGGDINGYAVLADGSVRAWGAGHNGMLGNGADCDPCIAWAPVPVSNLSNVTQVAGFDSGGYALRADGTLWGWGDGFHGTLGTATHAPSAVPVQIPGLPRVSAVEGGWDAGYALVPNR